MVVEGADEEGGVVCLEEDGDGEGVRRGHPYPPVVGHVVDLPASELVQIKLCHLHRENTPRCDTHITEDELKGLEPELSNPIYSFLVLHHSGFKRHIPYSLTRYIVACTLTYMHI